MTQYSDLDQVNLLYQESENLTAAIQILDDGGSILSFIVGTRSIAPGQTASGLTTIPAAPVTPVTVNVPGSAPPQLIADLRLWMVDRQNEITAELAALGVTDAPPART